VCGRDERKLGRPDSIQQIAETTRVVAVAVRDNDCVESLQIDPQRLDITPERLGIVAGIE
jgi:hypothetical protein